MYRHSNNKKINRTILVTSRLSYLHLSALLSSFPFPIPLPFPLPSPSSLIIFPSPSPFYSPSSFPPFPFLLPPFPFPFPFLLSPSPFYDSCISIQSSFLPLSFSPLLLAFLTVESHPSSVLYLLLSPILLLSISIFTLTDCIQCVVLGGNEEKSPYPPMAHTHPSIQKHMNPYVLGTSDASKGYLSRHQLWQSHCYYYCCAILFHSILFYSVPGE